MWLLISVSIVVLGVALKYADSRRALRDAPVILTFPLSPLSIACLLPTTWWNPGFDTTWIKRFTLYNKGETIGFLPFLWGPAAYYSSSIEVTRQVVGYKSSFFKPEDVAASTLMWGMNLLGSDGLTDVWKRHRRIVGAAFNSKTFTLIWSESVRTYDEMISEEGWKTKDEVIISSVKDHTSKFALFIVSACAFGVPLSWGEKDTDGAEMTMHEALKTTSKYTIARIFAPTWVWRLPVKKLQHVDTAFKTLKAFMDKQIAARKAELGGYSNEDSMPNDVFSRLVIANSAEKSEISLTDNEVIGNTFAQLLAGHETTTNTLAAAMAFLALHQDEQEKAYNQVKEVLRDGRETTYDDFSSLDYVLCCFLESIRLWPSGAIIGREASEDVVLKISNSNGVGERDLWVRKGTKFIIDVIGLQYNPRVYQNPDDFKPSRWADAADRSAFTAFSIGPRTCVGNRFAQVEAVCFLSMFLKDWKLDVILLDGETREQWRDRVMIGKMMLVLEIGSLPIKMTRRAPLK